MRTLLDDSYAFSVGGAPVAVSEKGIAWPSDVEHKFGAYQASNFNDDPATRGGGTIAGDVRDDEHFIVWMRTAALANFRKLWGKIDTDIEAGTVITVQAGILAVH